MKNSSNRNATIGTVLALSAIVAPVEAVANDSSSRCEMIISQSESIEKYNIGARILGEGGDELLKELQDYIGFDSKEDFIAFVGEYQCLNQLDNDFIAGPLTISSIISKLSLMATNHKDLDNFHYIEAYVNFHKSEKFLGSDTMQQILAFNQRSPGNILDLSDRIKELQHANGYSVDGIIGRESQSIVEGLIEGNMAEQNSFPNDYKQEDAIAKLIREIQNNTNSSKGIDSHKLKVKDLTNIDVQKRYNYSKQFLAGTGVFQSLEKQAQITYPNLNRESAVVELIYSLQSEYNEESGAHLKQDGFAGSDFFENIIESEFYNQGLQLVTTPDHQNLLDNIRKYQLSLKLSPNKDYVKGILKELKKDHGPTAYNAFYEHVKNFQEQYDDLSNDGILGANTYNAMMNNVGPDKDDSTNKEIEMTIIYENETY